MHWVRKVFFRAALVAFIVFNQVEVVACVSVHSTCTCTSTCTAHTGRVVQTGCHMVQISYVIVVQVIMNPSAQPARCHVLIPRVSEQ